jgi:hypothetical protein
MVSTGTNRSASSIVLMNKRKILTRICCFMQEMDLERDQELVESNLGVKNAPQARLAGGKGGWVRALTPHSFFRRPGSPWNPGPPIHGLLLCSARLLAARPCHAKFFFYLDSVIWVGPGVSKFDGRLGPSFAIRPVSAEKSAKFGFSRV